MVRVHAADSCSCGRTHDDGNIVFEADSTMAHIGTALEVTVPQALSELISRGARVWCFSARHTTYPNDLTSPIDHLDDLYFVPESETVTLICISCDEPKQLADFPTPAWGTACTHDTNICSDCWQQWLDTQLSTTSAFQITCAQCNNTLHQNDMQALASPPILARYLDNSIRLCMSDDQNFRWCSHPSCASGQVHDAGLQGNIFTCVTCERKSCVDCNSEWHAGRSCEDYQTERQEEQAAMRQWEYLKEVNRRRRRGEITDTTAETLMNIEAHITDAELDLIANDEAQATATILAVSKACPNCNVRIQKTYGCDKMHCTHCLHDFCWICLADFRAIRRYGNTAHQPGCRWWA